MGYVPMIRTQAQRSRRTRGFRNAPRAPLPSHGASILEYGILLSFVGAASLAAVTRLGEEISESIVDESIALASAMPAPPLDPDAFVLEVHTEKFRIFPSEGGPIEVSWGSKEADQRCGTSFTAGIPITCEFASRGRYFISITGDMTRYGLETDENFNEDLIRVIQWGNTGLSSLRQAFRDTTSIQSVPKDLPDSVTILTNAFRNSTGINDSSISSWDVSNVVEFGGLFAGAQKFNKPLNEWNTSNGIDFKSMFDGAYAFNQDISNWDMSSAIELSRMFRGAQSFNQDLSSWETGQVQNMEDMFWNNNAFQGDISTWDTHNVTNMNNMFAWSSFDGDISGWDVSNVLTMDQMFHSNSSFSGDLSNWDVSSLTSADYMFNGAESFSSDLSGWCVLGISSQPTNFMTGSAVAGEPVWGTCP